MKIAWIDHTLDESSRDIIALVFEREYGLEIISESSFERFEEKYGKIEDYDGLLLHPGIKDQKRFVDLIKRLDKPAAFGTSSPNDYDGGRVPILSYLNEQSIVDFFLRQKVVDDKKV